MKNNSINYCRLNSTWREDFDSLMFEYNKGNTKIKISSPKKYLTAEEYSLYKEFMNDNKVKITECDDDTLILEVDLNHKNPIINKQEKVFKDVAEQITFIV